MVYEAMAKQTQLPRLGELEERVLEHLWEVDEADVNETHGAVGKGRGITPNTVGSALERLHRKGLVTRAKVSHAYRYRPRLGRDELAARRVLDAVGSSRALTGTGLLSAFVELLAEVDEASLDRLEDLIAEHRRREEGR